MKNKFIFYGFLLLLLLPLLTYPLARGRIDTANYEKREFAEFPELSFKTAAKFPERFDAYFNDRLPYKNQLVLLNNLKNDLLGEGSSLLQYLSETRAIRGKDKWLFYNSVSSGEETMRDFLCDNLYEEEELERIAGNYRLLQGKLAESGIELAVLFAANKEQVYPEHMPPGLVPKGDVSRTDQLAQYLREHTSVPLLYTKEALRKEKKNQQVFYKYDTHWNQLGGFVGTQVVNEHFHGEYVSLDDVSCVVAKEGVSGDLADLMSMRALCQDDTEWVVEDYKPQVTSEMTTEGGYYRFTSNAKDKRKVLVVMDSFGYAMMGMAKDFAQVTFAKETDGLKEYCETERPDIVLIEIVERRKPMQEEWCLGLYHLLEGGE